MRRVMSLLLLVAAAGAPKTFACGDKFVAFGQGIRFQLIYAAAHPGAILVYLQPGSTLAQPANRDRLVGILRLVGHRPQIVSAPEELLAAVTTGEFDIILTEPAEMMSVAESISAARIAPTVVQLLWEPTRQVLNNIDQQDKCTVAVTKRSHELLIVVNDVMDQRHNRAPSISCQRKRT